MTFLLRYWKPLAVLVLLAAAYLWGRGDGRYHAEVECNKAFQAEYKRQMDAEHKAAEALDKISKQYEKDKADAQAAHDRLVAELRAGTIRLRKQWTCPASAASSGEPDGGAELREQGAADLVRIAREADAQVRGLQQVIEADQAE